ncbi:MAG TPA: NAD(P) transhydrogenase subunit alpha [bacterium]|jgi:NAD(P) transhydrogenase subunit alpha
MRIFIPKETHPGETRVPVIPSIADKFVKLGAEVDIESGLGNGLGFTDDKYKDVGCAIQTDRKKGLADADMVLRLRKPPTDEIGLQKEGSIHASYMEPFFDHDLIKAFEKAKVNAICMEMIPRTTLAQKMDALSSQANLGGYVAVIIAAEKLTKALPMMMTPAGTLSPSKVFIIGVGVAGLQAIATAKRLGARVEAFDTRPVVEEQVRSLGAKFVKIDLGETGETKDGYAKALTEEQIKKQQAGMAKVCAQSDIVITTAQVFGRKAPVIVTEEMVAAMQPGSIVLDMAVETGGNVVGSKLGEEVVVNGVTILGPENLPGYVPVHSSQMYASNLYNLVEHFWDKEANTFKVNLEDEILDGCMIVRDGALANEMLKNHWNNQGK